MRSSVFCLVAACLIMSGCGTVGMLSWGNSRAGELLPSSRGSNFSDSSFRLQVENDPFPTSDMPLRVKQ